MSGFDRQVSVGDDVAEKTWLVAKRALDRFERRRDGRLKRRGRRDREAAFMQQRLDVFLGNVDDVVSDRYRMPRAFTSSAP